MIESIESDAHKTGQIFIAIIGFRRRQVSYDALIGLATRLFTRPEGRLLVRVQARRHSRAHAFGTTVTREGDTWTVDIHVGTDMRYVIGRLQAQLEAQATE